MSSDRQKETEAEMQSERVMCIYCGHLDVAETQEAANLAIAAHIMACPRRPEMRMLNLLLVVRAAVAAVCERLHTVDTTDAATASEVLYRVVEALDLGAEANLSTVAKATLEYYQLRRPDVGPDQGA